MCVHPVEVVYPDDSSGYRERVREAKEGLTKCLESCRRGSRGIDTHPSIDVFREKSGRGVISAVEAIDRGLSESVDYSLADSRVLLPHIHSSSGSRFVSLFFLLV